MSEATDAEIASAVLRDRLRVSEILALPRAGLNWRLASALAVSGCDVEQSARPARGRNNGQRDGGRRRSHEVKLMPTLESRLVIGAVDKTEGAFSAIQKHIAALDKQVGTLDKLMSATRGVAKANDPMIASIDRAAKSLQEEKIAAESLSRAMSLGVASADEMAAVQGRLARETSQATRAMAMQGAEAVRTSRKIKQERASKGGGFVGMGNGIVGIMVGYEAAEFGIKAVEGGRSTRPWRNCALREPPPLISIRQGAAMPTLRRRMLE